MHTIYQPHLEHPEHDPLTITGEEARHAARVKRLEPGAPVRVLNGRGLIIEARIDAVRKERARSDGEWVLDLRVQSSRMEPRTSPSLRVLTGVPKGDRLEHVIDGLSQVGASSWSALASARAVVDPREGKIDRLHRVCEESLKQCGRAWIMDIGERVAFADALHTPGHETIIADASGEPFLPRGVPDTTLLIGPEGGFTPEELTIARAAGARVCTFGVHTMRIEVAAVVAAGILKEAQARA